MTKKLFDTQIFDGKANRRIDSNGRLIIERSLLTRECVSQYHGKEIPDFQKLGLVTDHVYNVLRPAVELAKAINDFNMIPLLTEHIMDFANLPQKEAWAGCVSNSEIKDGKIFASINVWDESAIKDIQNESKKDLSVGYSCDFVKESGTLEGVNYDLVMKNIKPNHLALVERGRVKGAEVFDGKNIKKGDSMAKENKIVAAIKKIFDAEPELNADKPAVQDSKQEKILAVLTEHLGEEKAKEIITALEPLFAEEEVIDSEEEKPALAKTEEEKRLKDEEAKLVSTEKDKKEAQEIMDSAMKVAKAEAKAEMIERETAKEEVRAITGNLGILDSAADYYKAGCAALGVQTKGVHDSALKPMFHAAKKVTDNKASAAGPVLDADTAKSAGKRIDDLLGNLPTRQF